MMRSATSWTAELILTWGTRKIAGSGSLWSRETWLLYLLGSTTDLLWMRRYMNGPLQKSPQLGDVPIVAYIRTVWFSQDHVVIRKCFKGLTVNQCPVCVSFLSHRTTLKPWGSLWGNQCGRLITDQLTTQTFVSSIWALSDVPRTQ